MSRAGRTLVLVTLLVAAGCRDVRDAAENRFDPSTPGTLVVAAEVPEPGFWEGTPDDVTGGFEYELARALAEDFELRLEVVEVPFADVIEGRLGSADLALQEVSVTGERSERVDFSVPYFATAPTVLARRGSDGADVVDLATARDKRWAVQQATTEEDFVRDVIRPDDDPVVLADGEAVLAALEDGTADAALLDLAAALVAANDAEDLVAVARFDDGEPIAAVLPLGSDNVIAVDQALRQLEADGTLDDLVDQWLRPRFSTDPDDLPVILTG